MSILAISKISRPRLVSVTEKTGLCLTWIQTPKIGFLVMRLNYKGAFSSTFSSIVIKLYIPRIVLGEHGFKKYDSLFIYYLLEIL